MAEVIQQIGGYAGFAALLGLAVLSALYFSQARDLRRLREWAARAPERSAPARRPASQGQAPASRPGGSGPAPAGPAGPAPEPASPGASPAASGASGAAAGASAAQPAVPAAAGATASSSSSSAGTSGPDGPDAQSSAPSAAADAPAPTALRPGPPPPSMVGSTTEVGRPSPPPRTSPRPPSPPPARPPGPGALGATARSPGARRPVAVSRPEPRAPDRGGERASWPYVVLAVVGLLIVVGAGAFAVGLIGGREQPDPAGRAGGAPAPAAKDGSQGPVDPTSVTFSVLNGTGVDGLAKQLADELEAAGYRRGNVTNATGPKAESVILYTQGARADAQAVARELDVSQTEAADARSRSLAGDASVIVVVGADQTQ